jgi:hypothetical protein
MNIIEKITSKYPDISFLVADGFDDAIIGIDLNTERLVYSTSKCIEILMKDMSHEEAIEHFEFNVSGSYMGEKTPIWCDVFNDENNVNDVWLI